MNRLLVPFVVAVVAAVTFAGLWIDRAPSHGHQNVLIIDLHGSGDRAARCLNNMPVPVVVRDLDGREVAEFDSHGLPYAVFIPDGRLRVGIEYCPGCFSTLVAEPVSTVEIGFNGTTCIVRQVY